MFNITNNALEKDFKIPENDRTNWYEQLYQRVTDQFTLSRESLHNTHQWVITLTLGLTTALLALDGETSVYPDRFKFIVVLISIPLLFRFFVRSCLECSIQYKWITIRNALDYYYLYFQLNDEKKKHDAENYLLETICLYYFHWKSPKRLRRIVWENLRLAYLWPFILIIALLVWGFLEIELDHLLLWIVVLTSGVMLFEIFSFIHYRGFKYEKTTCKIPNVLTYETLKLNDNWKK